MIKLRRKKNNRRLNSEINVTPFVDVILVLLIIFMVASPMLIAGIEVDLPQANSEPLRNDQEPLVISIDKTGQFYLQNILIAEKELNQKLSAILKEKKDTKIFVKGDAKVPYGKVIELFDFIKSIGLANVSLVTENRDAK